MRIGFYGGTFDPIHHGHLILARDAMEHLELHRLIFIPNALSPHKQTAAPAPAAARGEMIAAAIAGEPGFAWDDLELRRPGPSYTIDTMIEMRSRHPDADLFHLIGEDNLPELHTWQRIGELERIVQFVILQRGPGAAPHPYLTLRHRRLDISATEIRARVARGEPVRYLVPDKVLTLIEKHHLYQTEEAPSQPPA